MKEFNMFTCEICNKKFSKSTSLRSHKRVHTGYKPKPTVLCCSILTGKEIDVKQLIHHNNNYLTKQKECPVCGKTHFKPKFCSKSCSASHNNTGVKRSTSDTKPSNCCVCGESTTVNKRANPKQSKCSTCKEPNIVKPSGPYSYVYLNICKKSGTKFYWPTYKKYHPALISTRDEYVTACQFQFALTNYPEWFDLDLIKMYGMYSTPGSRRGIKNLNGISRDHLLSINDGWLMNIPTHIIRHPANCTLVRHKDNQSKNKKSIITYQELLEMIDEFNLIY